MNVSPVYKICLTQCRNVRYQVNFKEKPTYRDWPLTRLRLYAMLPRKVSVLHQPVLPRLVYYPTGCAASGSAFPYSSMCCLDVSVILQPVLSLQPLDVSVLQQPELPRTCLSYSSLSCPLDVMSVLQQPLLLWTYLFYCLQQKPMPTLLSVSCELVLKLALAPS